MANREVGIEAYLFGESAVARRPLVRWNREGYRQFMGRSRSWFWIVFAESPLRALAAT
jgi:hypothetical protein